MKLDFIRDMLTGIGNGISSKRVAMFIFIFAFLGEHVMYYIFGKVPEPTLRDELFYTLTGLIVTVFGEQFLKGKTNTIAPLPPPDQK